MKKALVINVFAIIMLFIVAILIVKALTPYGAATTPDSLSYLDIATNIKNGNGIRATDFSLENVDRAHFLENRWWPPLYPILLSTVVKHSADVISVTHLSMALLFITAFLVYLILISYTHWYIALFSALLLCITSPMITIYNLRME